MGGKLVFLILVLSVVSLEAKLHFQRDFPFSQRTILNYLFPKSPHITRVRKPEEVRTGKNATVLDFIGLVERHGYSAEEHYVTSEDGYDLVVHRISRSPFFKDSPQKKQVVFLQHGIWCTSDCWVLLGPDKDLAFLLADQGYDVWLGNWRGNSYCRRHRKISPQDKEFWQFSQDEIATNDLPVMIDYVLHTTKQKTLRYIGHSMGTTVLLILLSTKPEYNAKIKIGVLLSPVGILKDVSAIIEPIRPKIPQIKEFFDSNEIYEVVPLTSTSVKIARTLCAERAITQPVCTTIMFLITGFDAPQVNTTALPEILSYFPAGGSTKNLYHYYQNIMAQKFQAYDYGPLGNYKHYGQKTPLIYDLKKIVAPLALFYGANDQINLRSNVLETSKFLPNVVLLEENPYKMFNHIDFTWAKDGKFLLFDRLIGLLQAFDVHTEKRNNYSNINIIF
ncbi:lipase 3 [Solenopsis invicta]|uniref:lipase 3 n=1 Tax=Solenopsis invicta TaxID=13686 RepID=UPI000E33DAE0|nr:lipase 3 [Solenopsis invicta]